MAIDTTSPGTPADAAQLFTLRHIGELLAAQAQRLEGVSGKMDDVRERLVRLEAQDSGKIMDGLRAELRLAICRIDQLESQRDRVAGVALFWTWLARVAPWFATAIGAFLAGLGLKHSQAG